MGLPMTVLCKWIHVRLLPGLTVFVTVQSKKGCWLVSLEKGS